MKEGHDISRRYAELIVSLNKLQPGEEVADFEGGRFWSVRTVSAIVADAGAEIVPDGAGSGFLGVGGAHSVAPFEDRAVSFEDHGENLAGAHEVSELAEEGTRFMYGVESTGFFFGETHGLDGNDLEASFVDARKDFALLPAAHGVRLDNCESALE